MSMLFDMKDPMTIQQGGQTHQGITCNINTDCSHVVQSLMLSLLVMKILKS